MPTADAAPPRLREPRHRVSSRAIWFWSVRAVCGWLVVLALEVLVLLAWERDPQSWRYAVVIGTAALAVVHLAVMPLWRYRVHRWELTAHAAYTQAGWFNQERRIAPVSRIQTVDIHRGPLEQLFGLANVTITTASAAGPLKIHGLDRATAEHVVEQLTAEVRASGDAT